MLKKKNRADRKTIEQIFKSGRLVETPGLSFRFLRTPGALLPRVSFIVPKSLLKKATDRNKLRRQGYYALAKHIDKFQGGLSGAFVFKKKKNYAQDLEHEIEIILRKIN